MVTYCVFGQASLSLAVHYQKIPRHNKNIPHALVIITSLGGRDWTLLSQDLSERNYSKCGERLGCSLFGVDSD